MQLAHPFIAFANDIMLLLWRCNGHWLQESFSVGPEGHPNPWCSKHGGWSSAQAKRTCKVKPSIWCWNCPKDQSSPPTTPLALACAHPTFGGLEDWNGAKPTLVYWYSICNSGLCMRVERLSHSHHLSLSFPFGAISSSVRQQQLAISIGHTF